MSGGEALANIGIMLLCYGYVLLIMVISSALPRAFDFSQKNSRKFLHMMIGNLPFVIPFFTSTIYPVLVAAPFILVTFIASPYSPLKNRRFSGLMNITEEGHPLGLILYAVSYTLLALFFASQPYVIAAGILPMAYGDSAASLVGGRYGKKRCNLAGNKSLEGSIAMFIASLLSLTVGMIFFSSMYSFSITRIGLALVSVVVVTTLVESMSPKGFDNLTVPILGSLTFWVLTRGL